MSDADNGQRLGAIFARLRAVAASTSAQQGRYLRVQALAQYSPQPAHPPEGLAGAVQPTVALEVAACVAVLRRILAFDPGASPVESDKGRAQLHDLESVAVSGPNPYTAPSNGADREPETHRHSPDSGQCQAPPSNLTAALPGRPSQAPSGGERSALPPPLTMTTPEVTTAPEVVSGSDPTPEIRVPLTQATASPEPEGKPPFRRVLRWAATATARPS
eukprot:scaffold12892_cov121-Isochrysis_galbana.AAC.2